MEFFSTETAAFNKCYASRPASPAHRILQFFLDIAFCSSTNAFVASFIASVLIGCTAYTLSKITRNDSWIDRGWSVFPVIYAWMYYYIPNTNEKQSAAVTGGLTSRLLFAICITLWGCRMTFNFWRRGGYTSGGEDYRWEVVRKFAMFKSRIVWELFSFGFISIFQSLLLWAETLPLLVLASGAAPTPLIMMVAGGFLIMLFVETLADEQQWVFQNGKYKTGPRYDYLSGDYKRGFLTHGLFAYTRHPNVFAEQSMWTIIYGLSIGTWGLFNASGIGALALVILTIRSCVLTEEISSAKYPDYKLYQNKTNSLVPSRVPAKF